MLRTGSNCLVWYQTGVCRCGLVLAVAVLVAVTGCTDPRPPPSSSPTATSTVNSQVNPARISRVRSELPAGYEVADVNGPASPAAFWGFGPGWTTEPPQCAALAGPATDDATPRGWSGSGPGGIVHAAVTGSPTSPGGTNTTIPCRARVRSTRYVFNRYRCRSDFLIRRHLDGVDAHAGVDRMPLEAHRLRRRDVVLRLVPLGRARQRPAHGNVRKRASSSSGCEGNT